jgi:hypothetical protein
VEAARADDWGYLGGMAARKKKQLLPEGVVTGRIEKGRVRLHKSVAWEEGQPVVVIPLPPRMGRRSPPVELLKADATEMARRPGSLRSLNRRELE